ncbi:uncharacterized protein LOC123867424 [Maniola jurtina]|uniref:uncharacterized protein LOC123867424 n=1 Tax=Maniola jurtina TaxID=191418 RepID=UPI001E68EC6C|nr:uncharacterized protein LOC123867424 [Maniola jurtina]XP_045765387.1 uncharacterized protein LOC123867424 [Maniola jurtina]XP_045765388.1 uncharacterized protein LOC123867424 [Maniola jurtina]XP_045765390.1 uncharacterized protein LOC123867424 [Maniola jurtina]XP_045765391.1 uncharacterized protein LOC123867424 [Maniola jurtina]
MDVSFNNVLEGTRQYFMGIPKQAQGGTGQQMWPASAATEEGTPALSGAPTPSSRPPSVAAAPPPTPASTPVSMPPRPPSEPLEPEPHIIHKATVMREAAEKRREQPDIEDEEEPGGALSPPSHIIRKPTPHTLPSPAPAPAAPSPSPARPPSEAPPASTITTEQVDTTIQYRPPAHRAHAPSARPPDHFTSGRPIDHYSASRPPESYPRYQYETSMPDTGRNSHGPPVASPQPSVQPRQSPQTYARISSSMPQHTISRLTETTSYNSPTQRYSLPPTQAPPPHNDRVPPIHHPQHVPPTKRINSIDNRSSPVYSSVPQRRESPSNVRTSSQYERHPTLPQRKYDPQQIYSGYRPTPSASLPLPISNQRVDPHQQVQFKHSTIDAMNASYAIRGSDRVPPPQPPLQPHEMARLAQRVDYVSKTRTADSRNSYPYVTPSTSAVRYASSSPAQAVQNNSQPHPQALPSRSSYRTAVAPKTNYDYATSNHVQISPSRSTAKPGYPSQQARMTVSVTSIVDQMNQTKQKRESPLDLSVKTVKNSADSSTTQDDAIDSASMKSENLPIQSRPTSSSRNASISSYVASHKVDFSPDFAQYRDRNMNHAYNATNQNIRYNGAYNSRPGTDSYDVESRHPVYPERSKSNGPVGRTDYVPRIDLTRTCGDDRYSASRIRDDRHLIIEERKRPAGPIVSNIPEKILRHETWTADSRIEQLSQSAREQRELMIQPVYSYASHKRLEASQHEQKRSINALPYREHHHHHHHHRYSSNSCPEGGSREVNDYHPHYHEKIPSNNNRHIIQKIPSHRDLHQHNLMPLNSAQPADKKVLSILRNSLETKQSGYLDTAKSSTEVPDLIVIDDVDDSVIEITDDDVTKDNDVNQLSNRNKVNSLKPSVPSLGHHIKMPKAVDSITRDLDYPKFDSPEVKRISPENDVASRIRTKAELKVMPPSQDCSSNLDMKLESITIENNTSKPLPKSQKQHLFNQIREDNLRLESVIKNEKHLNINIPEIKTEPMNIDEIERDAILHIKTEHTEEKRNTEETITSESLDMDWAHACDSFMEQLKTGCHKKRNPKKRSNTLDAENELLEQSLESSDMKEDKHSSENRSVMENSPPLEISGDKENKQSLENKDIIIDDKQPSENSGVQKDKQTSDNSGIQQDKQPSEICGAQKNKQPSENSVKKDKQPSEVSGVKKDKQPSENKIVKEDKQSSENIDLDKDKQLSESSDASLEDSAKLIPEKPIEELPAIIEIKKEPIDEEDQKLESEVRLLIKGDSSAKNKQKNKPEKPRTEKQKDKENDKSFKNKTNMKMKNKLAKNECLSTNTVPVKKEVEEIEPVKTIIKEELESTDDDEPLIKSKLLKDKQQSDQLMKYQLLKDLSEKSAYVKLECCDERMNSVRNSLDSGPKEDKQNKGKSRRHRSKSKGKSLSLENIKREKPEEESSSDSDDTLSVASRLRVRKNVKTEENKTLQKTPLKSSPKKMDSANSSTCSTPLRKPGFGDGSDFHPGWEEELYRYKRSLRMPTRLIAIPRGRSGGPFVKSCVTQFSRGSTSLPDLDPVPLSPAPSSAPSAATDDIYRRPDKLNLDSDLESNSSCSAMNKLHYDSEASTSTVFSATKAKKKSSSIVDVLIQKCGKKEESKKKSREKEEKSPKVITKTSNNTELLPTPSLGLVKNGNKGNLSAKKEKLMEDIFYLGAFRKETVTMFRTAFIKDTNGLIGATEEFAPVVLKSRTRTESRVLKQRATIKEVFGDDRPASAPPSSCREEIIQEDPDLPIKEEPEIKPKFKPKKMIKEKLKRRSSSIRDGLRSTKSLKTNDAKGRMMRLKKRNSVIKSFAHKKRKEISNNKVKKETSPTSGEKDENNVEGGAPGPTEGNTKRRLKRLFGRRKFSSGFDYIRKKKKIIRREDHCPKVRRAAPKPNPESVQDIQKEIKGWFINKSIGETHLHRAARLGFTDCVAYCLEKMESDPSAKDNAGFTPLHVASAKGHVRIARLLLQYGANVSAAAQGGIRPLHEACENCHVEIIRLLLSYGADPLLGTYAGQMPEELAEGTSAKLLRLYIADVQGRAIEPWRFPPPDKIIDREEIGCDPLSSPPPATPPPPPDATVELQCTEAPLPPFYSLRAAPGQPADGLWCLLQDITNILQIKSKDSLLKQIHCGSGSPKELLREIRTQEFLERAQCHQLLGAGEKVNVRASKVALVRVTDKLRQLLKIETVLVS